jgi:predicted enzyme related to lactoylglutathione lyase
MVEVLASRVLLHPRDPERSRAFYRDVLGLAVYREFAGGIVFYLGGGFLEISRHAESSQVGAVALWLQVRDVAAALAEVVARGARVLREARLEPWGLREAWLGDPDGIRIVLVEVPPDHPLRRDPRS